MKPLNNKGILVAVFVVCLLGPLSVGGAERPDDTTISFWVAEAFVEDPRVNATAVDVQTTDGIVTLTGSVRSLAGKKHAELEARKINGVRNVVNNLAVEVVSRPDLDVAQDIRHRFINSTLSTTHGFGVSVKDGVATLTGEIGSWPERREAERLASEVRGVKEVRNQIVTAYRSQRSDADIRNDVRSSISSDVYLSGLPISIAVKQGLVTLQGETGNAYQKERAGRIAHQINDVKDVENKLTVQWWPERGKRKSIATPTDQELQVSIQNRLNQDMRIDASKVTVRQTLATST